MPFMKNPTGKRISKGESPVMKYREFAKMGIKIKPLKEEISDESIVGER